ncbi:MAG: hypothetical protein E6X17_03085 [Sporomusaceae bacterium]|nr:hypothetical protein [Sporomusaceae bacterium]
MSIKDKLATLTFTHKPEKLASKPMIPEEWLGLLFPIREGFPELYQCLTWLANQGAKLQNDGDGIFNIVMRQPSCDPLPTIHIEINPHLPWSDEGVADLD